MATARRIPVLMYHRVARPSPGTRLRGMCTEPAELDRQLRWLGRRGYTTWDFDDLLRASEGRAPWANKPVLLTFDDGHLDNHAAGLPVLRAHGAKASVFVLVGEMGARGVTWPAARETEPADLFDWDQAEELQAAGVRIEVHALRHSPLTDRAPRELQEELSRCRDRVQERLGRRPVALAYPFGAVDASARAAAQGAGFRFACTTRRGLVNPGLDDPWALPRLRVRGYRWLHRLEFRWNLTRPWR